MSSLKDFQLAFLDSVHPQTLEEKGLCLRGAGQLTAKEALRVYTQDYVIRMTEVLGEHYSACWKVLGDDEFLLTCEEYIKEYPSSFKSLSHYGEYFPEYLQRKYEDDFSFIKDLAQFEFEFQKLFHLAPNLDKLAQEQVLAQKVISKESFYCASSLSDLIYLWEMKDSSDDLSWDEIESEGIFILYKENYQVKMMELPRAFEILFDRLDRGETFEQIMGEIDDAHFLDLKPESWASFFTALMYGYRLR